MALSRRSIVSIVAALAVAVAASFGVWLATRGDDVPPVGAPMTQPTPTPTPTPSTTTPARPAPPTFPLTGQPLTKGARPDHPAVAIKVSNVRSAQPQAGVDRADIVFVTPIGVSYTRLVAVFHSQLPTRVGPVRSARPMDVPLLSPMMPVFGHTMAARWVVAYVSAATRVDSLGTLQVRSSSGAYRLDSRRPAPDHVFANPVRLLALSDFTKAPKPYFSYAAEAGSATAATASGRGAGVSVPYGPGWTTTWAYDAKTKRYLRSEPWGPHRVEGGKQVAATNVLVLHVASKVRKIGTAGGAPVPILQVENASGEFVALAGGHSVKGRWSKKGVAAPLVLTMANGSPLELAPGNTWVELPTPTAKVTTR